MSPPSSVNCAPARRQDVRDPDRLALDGVLVDVGLRPASRAPRPPGGSRRSGPRRSASSGSTTRRRRPRRRPGWRSSPGAARRGTRPCVPPTAGVGPTSVVDRLGPHLGLVPGQRPERDERPDRHAAAPPSPRPCRRQSAGSARVSWSTACSRSHCPRAVAFVRAAPRRPRARGGAGGRAGRAAGHRDPAPLRSRRGRDRRGGRRSPRSRPDCSRGPRPRPWSVTSARCCCS